MHHLEAPSPIRYQNIARIGRGGMAEVSLAIMRSSGVVKLAVLKYLWPELAEDPEVAALFLDEARLCARLGHPNLVQTFEVLQHDGRLAMAMEYLDGQPLTRVMNRLGSVPDLSMAGRLRIVTNVLSALDYAHDLRDFDGTPLGLVHRDVSPHNVFVTYAGHIKLLDFGIAKTLVDQHHTRPGGFRGKIAYLAPECLRGGEIDRRADLFSVGILLWEVLAGQRFWKGASESTIAWNLATGAPARPLPPELDVPDGLRAVCLRALEPDPEARYQTAAALAADLTRFDGEPDDAHARQLGLLVSGAFGQDRAERQALIESHLRSGREGSGRASGAYESLEVRSEEPPEEVPSDEPSEVLSEQPEPQSPPPSLVAHRSRRGSRTLMTATIAAAIALVAGSYLGRQASAWSDRSSWLEDQSTPSAGAAHPRLADAEAQVAETVGDRPAEPAMPPVVVPIQVRPETTPRARGSRRAHRASHPRPLDLTSDEVLGLDGEPLADGPTR